MLLLAAALTLGEASAHAKRAAYVPRLTQWGDPDFRATWTTDRIAEAGIPLERPVAQGDRAWLTNEEFAKRLDAAKKSDAGYQEDVDANGTVSLAQWVQSATFAHRTSLIVSPANGRLPPMTVQGEALFKAGRNSWLDKQPIDWVADLDSYDRCVARGVDSAILPWPNNNGVRIFQSPGFVALQLEVFGARIVPIGRGDRPMPRSWRGASSGHWEGNTLVIETNQIVAGDSVSGDHLKRSSSPITGRGHGTVPIGPRAHTTERLTMTGPGSLTYQVTYSDPDVFTAPWTAEVEWLRDDTYRIYEYACHEGNGVREWITASRAQRRNDARSQVRR
uniref:hypothetical protein n=1 Tax=Altererythrobacter segetis TaxID=1104773 RepID=UPI0014079D3B|nr:hypothetical protein [Altererythrobacter segetis]